MVAVEPELDERRTYRLVSSLEFIIAKVGTVCNPCVLPFTVGRVPTGPFTGVIATLDEALRRESAASSEGMTSVTAMNQSRCFCHATSRSCARRCCSACHSRAWSFALLLPLAVMPFALLLQITLLRLSRFRPGALVSLALLFPIALVVLTCLLPAMFSAP